MLNSTKKLKSVCCTNKEEFKKLRARFNNQPSRPAGKGFTAKISFIRLCGTLHQW